MPAGDGKLFLVTAEFIARVERLEQWVRTFSLTGDGLRVNRSASSFSASLSLPRPPPSSPPAAAGLKFQYGTLNSLWNPGDSTVALTPCKSYTDNTATGDPTATVLINFGSAYCLDAVVGQIMVYIHVGVDGSNNPVYKLFDPPVWPKPTALNQGIFNASGSPTAPHYVAQYAEGH